MFIGLFTVRIILQALGEEDYGLYTVVGGILAFITFIGGALRAGSQRFFSYSLGTGDIEDLNKTFKITYTIYAMLSGVIVLLGEVLGIWFINSHLNVNPERLFAANVVFQFIIISTGFTLIVTPYKTAIMAHEDMGIFGKMAIVDAIVKIAICALIVVSPWDKLISYAFLLMLATIVVEYIYLAFAKKRYDECIAKLCWDKCKLKEIAAFSGWNLFGNLAWVVKTQGVSILLNLFFGPVVNAAQGVATTVRNVSGTFSQNFSSALSPQIVKQYANKNYDTLAVLIHRGSKMTFYLMLVVVIPLIFCIDYILLLWIGPHSAHMSSFCRLLLLEALIDSISTPLASVNQATGKIAVYQTLIGLSGILVLPVAYVFIANGYAPEWVFIVSVLFQIIIVAVRIVFLHRVYPGAMQGAIKNIVLPCVLVTIVSVACCYVLRVDISTVLNCIGAIVLYAAICLATVVIVGLNRTERSKIREIIKSRIGI